MIYKTSKVLESHNEHLYNAYILIIKAKCWFCNILIHYSLFTITFKNRLYDSVKSE